MPNNIFVPKVQTYQDIYEMATLAVQGDISLVILGETGVGKGTLVSYIHQKLLPKKPLITVNCGAICSSLAEAELFGSELGAFTGSTETRKGKLELANDGILFLDEVGNLSPDIQNKLLCAIESKTIMRVGGTKELQLNFKLITATNTNLEEAVKAGQFRADLYYRIKQFSLELPPIRKNPKLIQTFAAHYITIYNKKYNCNFNTTDAFQNHIMTSPWHGNLRELKNEIKMRVWLHSQKRNNDDIVINLYRKAKNTINDEINDIEAYKIKNAISTHSNISAAARALNIHRSTLQGKLKKHGLYPIKSSTNKHPFAPVFQT